MMRFALFFSLGLFLWATPALAAPCLVEASGLAWKADVLAANAGPTEADTASVAIVHSTAGTVLSCAPSGPGQQITLTFTVPKVDVPIDVHAIAYDLPGCTGRASGPSVDKCTVLVSEPGVPLLLP